ncbi:hypothetical protein BT67DRAFT_94086 [Trichocladium antarcticum]|uniref:Uncharacterized protein n=1 Tax=Trichocladium antarcticum TaxID=1450529 RepID=A0AAN6ZBK1_9PEZI|nr:hypothetical protein BT67DRAFT_94086 [Trichocladium antarcticum]
MTLLSTQNPRAFSSRTGTTRLMSRRWATITPSTRATGLPSTGARPFPSQLFWDLFNHKLMRRIYGQQHCQHPAPSAKKSPSALSVPYPSIAPFNCAVCVYDTSCIRPFTIPLHPFAAPAVLTWISLFQGGGGVVVCDVKQRVLSVELEEGRIQARIGRRRRELVKTEDAPWVARERIRGCRGLYMREVNQAEGGVDFRFLTASGPGETLEDASIVSAWE